MQLMVKKNFKKLYYINSRNGIGHHEKTFVRMLKKMKDGSYGSKMYCISRDCGLLFGSFENAEKLLNQYKTSNAKIVEYDFEKFTPDYKKNNYILEEIFVKGVRCYHFVNK